MIKRRFVQGLLILALLCGAVLLAHPSAAWALTGTGTQAEPYQISSAAELQEFAEKVNSGQNTAACAVLTADITINSNVLGDNGALNGDGSNFTQWTPIGNGSEYTGTFDGAGHTISGLYINSDAKYVGLFGRIGTNGTVKNLTLADSYINSRSSGDCAYVGGICGYNYKGSITNCHNSGSVAYTGSGAENGNEVGGICGLNDGGITTCSNSGKVVSNGNTSNDNTSDVGGICGLNFWQQGGSIENCSNSGDVSVSGVNAYSGGICGYNWSSITTCSNSGKVTGSTGSGSRNSVGGVCGWNYAGFITNCSNSGEVSGNSVGGICGVNDGGSITNCSNSGDVSGSGDSSTVSGICGWNYGVSITNCYWLSGTAGAGIGGGNGTNEKVESKTDDQYASGEVAWLLNGSSTNGPWRQNLTGTNIDKSPTLDPTHGVVGFSNGAYHNCTYDVNGFCTCGSYEAATQDDAGTYQISNAGQLYWFAELVNGGQTTACAVLTTDITINSNVLGDNGALNGDGSNFTQWTPIGDVNNKYIGTFDGAGYSISGLYIDSDVKYAGLFGYIGTNGTVKNLALADSYINSSSKYSYVGGICGVNYDGSITSCSNNGDVTGSGDSSTVGGICGWSNGSITTSSNSGAVGGGSYVGGICGRNWGSITTCSNSGAVGGGSYVGGICGQNWDSITNCYWLSGTAGEGIGSGGGEATKKNAEDYATGEVAWLLNQWQDDDLNLNGKVWAVGKDGYPVLNGKSDNIVVKLTFDTNTGKEEEQPIIRYGNVGDALPKVTLPEITGYTFAGWYNDADCSGEQVTKIPDDATGDKTYYAKWTANVYTVTLNTNNGTINSGDVTSYTYGIGATLPTDVTRSGYTFDGWYDNDALSGEPVTTISANATGDQTYWAKWTAKQTPPPTIPPTVSEETIDAIGDAQPGETVTVDLSHGDTTLDKEVFETLAGKDVTLVVDLGDGVSWTVNGTDVPADADFTDIDMGVTLGSDGIPVDLINAITGEHGSVQVELAHNGAFGFTMTLTAPVGEENAGLWANLYHFKVNDGEAGREGPLGDNEEAGKMTFETAAQIGSDGNVALAFSHASQYAIVIDDHNHGVVELPFTDVSEGDWFYDPVCFVYSQGLMTGTSATTFEPNTSLSRAMLVAVLHRLEGSPAASGGDFTDVVDGDWYAQAVNWAASVGVVNGFDDGTFQPNTAITREQMAAILRNYAAYKGLDVSASGDLSTYTDAESVSAWAKESVEWAVGQGLLSGMTVDTLQPQGLSTRAQVAAVFQRYLAN